MQNGYFLSGLAQDETPRCEFSLPYVGFASFVQVDW